MKGRVRKRERREREGRRDLRMVQISTVVSFLYLFSTKPRRTHTQDLFVSSPAAELSW